MSSLYYLGLCFCRSIINLRQLCNNTIYMVVHKLLNLQQQTTFKRCIAKISSFTHTLNMQHRLGFEETAVSNQITAASRQLQYTTFHSASTSQQPHHAQELGQKIRVCVIQQSHQKFYLHADIFSQPSTQMAFNAAFSSLQHSVFNASALRR